MTAIVLALFTLLPQEFVVRETCDLMEVNHFYDGDEARHVFDQLIFYSWDGNRYQVLSWRLIKSDHLMPARDWRNGGYSVLWQDGEVVRRVNSRDYRETWTQHDVELVEREVLPKERRKELISDSAWQSIVRAHRGLQDKDQRRGLRK